MVAYTFNKFPYGIFEISAVSLLQREKSIGEDLYTDIIKLINEYTAFLEEHIKYCNDFYVAYNKNKIIIECMANYDHMDILNSTTEHTSHTMSDIKNQLSNIESGVDIVYSNIIRDVLWRRYRIYKNQINMLI
jgi:hypothetical protein